MLSNGLVSAAYIAASVLFILALGGLSEPGKRETRGLVRHRRHGGGDGCHAFWRPASVIFG